MTTVDDSAERVLIDHQRHRGGCLDGWFELGKSFAAHQVGKLRDAGLLQVDSAEPGPG